VRVAPAAALLLIALCPGCRWTSADEQLLIEFFDQSRVYDRTRLSRLATVVFNPATDGIVHRFDIVDRGPERTSASGAQTRDVTIRAAVLPPEGPPAERLLVVTLTERDGRWIVTAVRAQPAEGT
jgi:hypothetical protein